MVVKNPLAMVVAATPAGVIGSDSRMPWCLGSDLGRFKRLTMGGVLLMGRKTFESIGRPLPGRHTIVLSRNRDWAYPADCVDRVGSAEEAMRRLEGLRAAGFVVGGAEVYRLLFPWVDRIWLTRVWSETAGDTRIDADWTDFRLSQVSRFPQSERDSAPTELQKWERTKNFGSKLAGPH